MPSAIELTRVAAGRSEVEPAKGDRRFGERAWQDNWLLRRVMQSYLAGCDAVDRLITDADLDWRTERQARFAATNVLDALAPTNFPWSNPAVLKESIDEGGANLVRGGRRFARDMTRSPHLPASVDVTKFEVGVNLAVTPGSVVMRNEVLELIHYRPTTRAGPRRYRCCSCPRRSTSTTSSTSRPDAAWWSGSSAASSRCS